MIASSEPCTSDLTTTGELLGDAGGDLREHLLERAARARGRLLLAAAALAVVGDVARLGLVLGDDEVVARQGRAVEAQHLDRARRSRLLDGAAALVDERAHAAPFAAGDEDVADLERAALDQHGRDRAAAALELRLDDAALGGAIGIGA